MVSIQLWSCWRFYLILCISLDVAEAQHYPLRGVHTNVDPETGARPIRRNILDLESDMPTWSLYVQALTAMQQTPEDDELSWFQISGIHGRPFYAWDNYPWNPAAPEVGYCPHKNALFPTWHRPYIALYEQILAGHVQAIAKEYTSDVELYQSAADNFRVPYWDWATDSDMPKIVNQPIVLINTPTGPSNVKNPLLLYRFQQFPLNATLFPDDPGLSFLDQDLSQDPTTLRSPCNGTSEPNSADGNLASLGLQEAIYAIFTQSTAYYNMATEASAGPSFELVHDGVHDEVGGMFGHMASFPYSAFDPIFFLHHANVDRLFAMWQAIYFNEFLAAEIIPPTTGTFTIPVGINVTALYPLTPFTTGDGNTTYTSSSSRFTKYFGYSYPEVEDWVSQTAAQLAANVTSQVNFMYNPNGIYSTNGSTVGMRSTRSTKSELGHGHGREWSVTIQASRDALAIPYVIGIFLGVPPINPTDWTTSENLVVTRSVALHTGAGDGPLASVVFEIPLTRAFNKIGLDGVHVGNTTKYLQANLHWAVREVNAESRFMNRHADGISQREGDLIPNDQVSGLQIAVYEQIVTHPKDITEFPKYQRKTLHLEVTIGKAGGAQNTSVGF